MRSNGKPPLKTKDEIPTSPPPPKSRNNEFQPLLQKPSDDQVTQAATLGYAILLYHLTGGEW